MIIFLIKKKKTKVPRGKERNKGKEREKERLGAVGLRQEIARVWEPSGPVRVQT
jgi:hypothetical protein